MGGLKRLLDCERRGKENDAHAAPRWPGGARRLPAARHRARQFDGAAAVRTIEAAHPYVVRRWRSCCQTTLRYKSRRDQKGTSFWCALPKSSSCHLVILEVRDLELFKHASDSWAGSWTSCFERVCSDLLRDNAARSSPCSWHSSRTLGRSGWDVAHRERDGSLAGTGIHRSSPPLQPPGLCWPPVRQANHDFYVSRERLDFTLTAKFPKEKAPERRSIVNVFDSGSPETRRPPQRAGDLTAHVSHRVSQILHQPSHSSLCTIPLYLRPEHSMLYRVE